MPAHTTRTHPALLFAHTNSAQVSQGSPLPTRVSAPVSTQRTPVTDRMVETVMISTILRLEEELIPAQDAGDLLIVYATGSEITHNVRRTLEIFGGDMSEAIDNICAFVIEDVVEK